MHEVRVTEIADGIYQLTTYLDEIDFGLNQWLAAAPDAIAATGITGCMVSVADIADRTPRSLADNEVLDIGGHRMRWIDTPHLPHGREAGLLYDETTKTLLCGDLFNQRGPYPPTTSEDIAIPGAAEDPSYSLSPSSPAILGHLAALDITTLAQMHGPAFTGDCRAALHTLADQFETRIATVIAAGS